MALTESLEDDEIDPKSFRPYLRFEAAQRVGAHGWRAAPAIGGTVHGSWKGAAAGIGFDLPRECFGVLGVWPSRKRLGQTREQLKEGATETRTRTHRHTNVLADAVGPHFHAGAPPAGLHGRRRRDQVPQDWVSNRQTRGMGQGGHRVRQPGPRAVVPPWRGGSWDMRSGGGGGLTIVLRCALHTLGIGSLVSFCVPSKYLNFGVKRKSLPPFFAVGRVRFFAFGASHVWKPKLENAMGTRPTSN